MNDWQEISPLAWWQHILPQIRDRSWYGEKVQVGWALSWYYHDTIIIQVVIQRPGDTLVIPSRAPHTVLNLDWSIGVTENILTHESLLGEADTSYHHHVVTVSRSASQAAGGRVSAARHPGLAHRAEGGEAVEVRDQEAGAARHRGQGQAQGGGGAGQWSHHPCQQLMSDVIRWRPGYPSMGRCVARSCWTRDPGPGPWGWGWRPSSCPWPWQTPGRSRLSSLHWHLCEERIRYRYYIGSYWAEVSSYIGILLIYPPVLFSFVKTFVFGGNTSSVEHQPAHEFNPLTSPRPKYTHYSGQRDHCSALSDDAHLAMRLRKFKTIQGGLLGKWVMKICKYAKLTSTQFLRTLKLYFFFIPLFVFVFLCIY